LLKELTNAILERALEAEMTDHLGKGDFGQLELEAPRDRKTTFEPKIVAKRQTRPRGDFVSALRHLGKAASPESYEKHDPAGHHRDPGATVVAGN
jgi:hypothetical protein